MPDRRDNDHGFTERELAEIEELNRLSDDHVPFLQRPLWRRVFVAFSLLIVLAFLVPTFLLSCGGGNGGEPAPPATDSASGLPTPDFQLAAAQGGLVSLSETLAENDLAVIVFYRGFF